MSAPLSERSLGDRRSASLLLVALALLLVLGASSFVVLPTGAPSTGSALAPHAAAALPPRSVEAPSAAVHPLASALPPTLPSWTPRLAPFHLAYGHAPQSWGGSPVPPGAPIPRLASFAHPSTGPMPNGTSDGINWTLLNEYCNGLWPSMADGQSKYLGNCYGHDEPGINPYSNLVGSGGNVTWNISLPVDRSPTQNQSNLYAAIWFGMTLADPYAWMDQCFLELQFYPDSSWSVPIGTVQGVWVGAAVAWQIEASTGYENPCFFSPLFVSGQPGTFFNMTQGDNISVTMSGWTGSAWGENLTIADTTSGVTSTVNLFNATGNYPLDPAYSTSSYPNTLQWTPGGEGATSFAFETGHASNPVFPENNSFGGCSPGAPPSTPVNPAVPCPSYDPGYWTNDTLIPWQIHPPTFFNATARQTATQMGLSQDLGGQALIDGSNLFGSFAFTCQGQEGSAYCTYPWYSYSCVEHAFNFGATDWSTTSQDFGKSLEFRQTATANAAALGFYPPTNVSVPACGSPSYTVTVAPTGTAGGAVNFLSSQATASTAYAAVVPGVYSIDAVPPAGAHFLGWATTLGVSVASTTSPYTTVTVTGTGTADAVFGAVGTTTAVTFASNNDSTSFNLIPGWFASTFGHGVPATQTVLNGSSVALYPGEYSVMAYPAAGFNFSGWAVSNGGAVLATHDFPMTWLTVTGSQTAVTVTASVAPSASAAYGLILNPTGSNVTFAGVSSNSTTIGFGPMPVGSYGLSIVPASGVQFEWWLYGGSAVMSNFSASTVATLEAGYSIFLASTYSVGQLYLNDSAASDGNISWDFGVPVASGTQVSLNSSGPLGLGGVALAVPAPGETFLGWTTNNPSMVWVLNPTSAYTVVFLNSSTTPGLNVTALFDTGPLATLGLAGSPAASGMVQLDGNQSYTSVTGLSVGTGLHLLTAEPATGQKFLGWNASGNFSFATDIYGLLMANQTLINVGSGGVNVTASFGPRTYPVTLVGVPPTGASGHVNGTAVASGDSVWLSNGTYPIDVALANSSFVHWVPSADLTVGTATSNSTTVTVSGPGSLYAVGTAYAGPILVAVPVAPGAASILPTAHASFNVSAVCLYLLPCPAGTTFSWSLGAPGLGGLNQSTGSSVTFTAGAVSGTETLTVVGALGPISVMSYVIPVAIVPQLTNVTVAPTTLTVYTGTSAALTSTLGCTLNLPCPAGATYGWSVGSPVLGTLNVSSGSTVTFTAGATAGTTSVDVWALLNGVNRSSTVPVTVNLPTLVSAAVAPASVSLFASESHAFSAAIACSQSLPCPAGTTYAWTLAPTSLGSLNSSSGSSVRFTAGASAGTGNLNLSATLNSVTRTATVALTVTVNETVTAVTLTPTSASLTPGEVQEFTASATCAPSPCPSGGVAFHWSTSSAGVGTLAPTSGASVNFTAGSTAGATNVLVNASLGSSTVSATAAVTVSSSSTGTTTTPLYQNPYLWGAIVVVLVVVVLAALLLRRRGGSAAPSGPTPGAVNGAPQEPAAPKDATDTAPH